ncbi:MAG: hypothetical protein M1817_001762 [Caeruleum heppii]|nr:MAG: hypothetical protein M1817_001762 [Caeruleum heppii]
MDQPGLLDSATHSPLQVKHYTNQDDVIELAAILSEKVIKNHAYQDGNKRTALVAADMFLKINGFQLQQTPMAADLNNIKLAMGHEAIAANRWTVDHLAELYRSVARKLEVDTEEIQKYRRESVEG